jgi:hypothetical protein
MSNNEETTKQPEGEEEVVGYSMAMGIPALGSMDKVMDEMEQPLPFPETGGVGGKVGHPPPVPPVPVKDQDPTLPPVPGGK